MLEKQLIEELRQRLVAETYEGLSETSETGALGLDLALCGVMLGDLEEAGALTDHEFCPHQDMAGQSRCRVLAYSLPEDGTRLELVTARFVDPKDSEHLGASDISKLCGQAARFFNYVVRGDLTRFAGSDAARDAATLIHSELARIEEVRVHVLTNAKVRDRAVDDIDIAGRRVEFSIWDLERLSRASGEEITRDRIEVDFTKLAGAPLPVLEMKPPPAEYQTFLLVLPGDVISDLYDEFGARLFEFNVRSFLQARGQVNKGLRETLKSQPERFLAYNNGLTATADEIEVGSLNGETVIYRLKGLQIVNGAQTTASINRAKKVDKIDVSRVAVSMKLTRVQSDKLKEFVPLIAKFANTQNPVQLADLSANNDFHIAIERLSDLVWSPGEESRWFYERARGAYEVARMRLGSTPAKRRQFEDECPKSKKFTKTDLAKVWMSWWEKPHIVSRGAQKNFAAFMADLPEQLPADWVPDEKFYRDTVGLIIIFKACQSAVRKAALQSYGANVVTYMLAKLKEAYGDALDLNAVWENQSVSSELVSAMVDWAPVIHACIVDEAGARNVTEFSKKEECWERIKMLTLPPPLELPIELGGKVATPAVAPPRAQEGEDDLIQRCVTLDGKDWAAVIAWAASSPMVTNFDRQVAHTLLGYALKEWSHLPTAKQAKIGVRVLDAAAEAGVLPAAA